MTTNHQHPPRIAAEFASIFAEQADLHMRAFRLIETLCASTFASPAATPDLAQDEPSTGAINATGQTVRDKPAEPVIPNDREQAVGDAIKVAGLRPEAVAVAAAASEAPGPAARAEPECPSSQPPISESVPQHPRRAAPGTKKDRVLDLYAETTLTTTQMSERLSIGKSSVSAFISLARTAKDPRALAGDNARRAVRIKANEPSKTPDAAPPAAAPVMAAPRMPDPAPPPSPALLKLKGQVRASMKDQVLDLYAETGDHASVIAQKLGLLRADVNAYVVNARASQDARTSRGDRLKARRMSVAK